MTHIGPARQLVRQLTWAESAVHAHGDRAAATAGQSLARWQVLDSFAAIPRTVPAAARRLRQSRQSVQRIVDLLAAEGLLVGHTNPDHRKSPLYATSGPGEQKLAELDATAKPWLSYIATRMPQEEILRLVELLTTLRAIADEYDPAAPGAHVTMSRSS